MKQKHTMFIFSVLVLIMCTYKLISVAAQESELVSYTVSFVSASNYEQKIFNTQSGVEREETAVSVTFPQRIIGVDGHLWTSVLQSPQSFTLYGAGIQKFYIEYLQGDKIEEPDSPEAEERQYLEKWIEEIWKTDCAITGQSQEGIRDPCLVVMNDSQNNSRIKNLVSILSDAEWHYFYMIGKNYTPKTLVIGTGFEVEYSSVMEDAFAVGNDKYQILKVGVKRKWKPESCVHNWKINLVVPVGCMENGMECYRCVKCEKEETVTYPALGHTELNEDSLCDRCLKRTVEQKIGDTIKTTLTVRGELNEVTFTCLDENYKGTGRMLYLSNEVLGPEITGLCYEEDNNYNLSPIRQYFNREFVNNSSVGRALRPIERADGEGLADYGAFLSAEEYRGYRAAGILKGTEKGYFLRTSDLEGEVGKRILAVDGDGEITSVEVDGSTSFGARFFILLDKPETGEQPEPHVWKEGDIRMLRVGKETYRFTCVDEDYSDAQDSHRKAALFLCDSVIRSDIDSDNLSFKTFSFGADNSYKTSHVRSWLDSNSSAWDFSLEPIYVGVNFAYIGRTKEGAFTQLSENALVRYPIGFQLLHDRLFCLSLEEALKYKEYLWKFNGSDVDNPESQDSPYSVGYYLRTPFYAEDEMGTFRYSSDIYVVDLMNGNIHTVGTDSDKYGLRPAFAVPQG